MKKNYLQKFYQKSRIERIDALVAAGIISEADGQLLRDV